MSLTSSLPTVLRAAVTAASLVVLSPAPGAAFGDGGAFHPRALIVGHDAFVGARGEALVSWSRLVVERTSAPARLSPERVHILDPGLTEEPFLVWAGESAPPPLNDAEVHALGAFFALGGILIIDDFQPSSGAFGAYARRELKRVLPTDEPVRIGSDHVLYRSFYRLKVPTGSEPTSPAVDIILRGGLPKVIFLSHDVFGAIAEGASGAPTAAMPSGSEFDREWARRFAVNVAMYAICTTYKDDAVHAAFLLRREAAQSP